MSENNFSFFSNKKCEYFPCHKVENTEDFNCLFCYCPLYTLGDDCGGKFSYTENGIKNCSDCLVPHRRNSSDVINSKFNQIVERMKAFKEQNNAGKG